MGPTYPPGEAHPSYVFCTGTHVRIVVHPMGRAMAMLRGSWITAYTVLFHVLLILIS